MSQKYANFGRTTIATAVVNVLDTSFDVLSSSLFPALTVPGDYFYATLVRMMDGKKEIVKVTNIAVNTWTVARGQDGTTALLFAAGDRVEYWVTAQLLRDMLAEADAYADAAAAAVLATSESYTDGKVAAAIVTSEAYTDAQIAPLTAQVNGLSATVSSLSGQFAASSVNSFDVDTDGNVWVKKNGVRINRLT